MNDGVAALVIVVVLVGLVVYGSKALFQGLTHILGGPHPGLDRIGTYIFFGFGACVALMALLCIGWLMYALNPLPGLTRRLRRWYSGTVYAARRDVEREIADVHEEFSKRSAEAWHELNSVRQQIDRLGQDGNERTY